MSELRGISSNQGRLPVVAVQTDSVGEIIQQAERHIASREFDRAQERLAEAWRQAPGNPYIPAIVERMEILQSLMRHESTKRYDISDPARFLALSVGKEFPGGIRQSSGGGGTAAQEELSAKVRRLTTVALSLLERGSAETAFETLMKAYVVDPMNPEIVSCASRILPVWEAERARSSAPQSPSVPRRPDDAGTAAALAQRMVRTEESSSPAVHRTEPGFGSAEQRLLALKRQREQERRLREREMWRAASKSPSPVPVRAARGTDPDGSSGNGSERKGGFLTSWVRRALKD